MIPGLCGGAVRFRNKKSDSGEITVKNIHALRQSKVDLKKQQLAMLNTARDQSRDLNATEKETYVANKQRLQEIEAAIGLEEERLQLEKETSGNALEGSAGGDVVPVPKFKSLGEQLIAVRNSAMGFGSRIDPRLIQAAASGTSEAVPSDGGFLVQTDFSEQLLQRTYADGQISGRVTRYPISAQSNRLKINAIDEDSRVDGSRWGGVQAFWANEADAFTGAKPKFRQIELALNKLTGLCYATDELLQDAAALEAVIMDAFPKEFTFKVEDAIVNGTGAGQPLGIINSGAVLQIAKDSGDSGPTVSTNDVLNMWSRMFATSRMNCVWLINQDVEPKLYPLTLGSGTAVILLYTPPKTGNNQQNYGQMLGAPVIPVEHCATLGTPGDIILADLSQYIMSDKGAPQAASSIHVRFLNDETTFRFVYRVDGQPTWKKPLTPKNGSNTQSPFITLATRS
jgi:HK97 family phage major capsid protein